MFESTLPFGEPELMRASAFRRALDETPPGTRDAAASRLSSLSPSLMLDLMRFEQEGRSGGALEVAAACMRHARRLLIHLQLGDRVVPLTLFPNEHLAHLPMPMGAFLDLRLDALEVLHVEPALLRPPGDPVQALVGQAGHYHPLAPVLWALAMRGPRRELLPEIAGPAAYRISPGLNLRTIALAGALAEAVARLKRETSPLRAIAGWPGFDRDRAVRLLNALYLQGGLIVSRTHRAAAA
jgi:hypothetical protein